MVDCGAGSAFGAKSVGRTEVVDSYGDYNWDLIRRNCAEAPWIANLVASTAPYELVTWQSPRGCVIIPVATKRGITYDNIRELIQVVISDGEMFVRALFKLPLEVEGNYRERLFGKVLLVRSCHVFPCESTMKCHFEYQLALEDVSLQNARQHPLQLTQISDLWENTSVTALLKIVNRRSTGIEFAWETMSSKGGPSADVAERLIKLKPKLQDRIMAMKSTNSVMSFWMEDERGNNKHHFWIVDNTRFNSSNINVTLLYPIQSLEDEKSELLPPQCAKVDSPYTRAWASLTRRRGGNSRLNGFAPRLLNSGWSITLSVSREILSNIFCLDSPQLDSNTSAAQGNEPLNGAGVVPDAIGRENCYTKPRTRWTDLDDWLLSVSDPDDRIGVIRSSSPHLPSVVNMPVENSFIEELNVDSVGNIPPHRTSQNSSLKDEVINQLLWAFKCLEDGDEER